MYNVKRSGRNGVALFDEEMERQLKNRVSFEEEIRQAIEADEFVPFFQPLISLDTGELNGFEVLARWRSPVRGLVEPTEFIEIAEQSGLIGALSMRVMEKALEEARQWPAHLKLAVNISPIQFRDPQLAERILKLLTRAGFPPKRLEVEITESSLMQDREQALTVVQSLRNSGISIALDDFGTGYASLSQLHALPFDRIKIDKSFINSLAFNEQSAAIVQTITALGKSLSVPITAEGVESETVRQQLAALGCSDAQGWYFGRAVAGHVAGMQFSAVREKSGDSPLPGGNLGRAGGQKW
jgi:EAL domain-containing protein (putative c-di-GMP-specific phosphodiesterase class I)